jgi:hypothetical protein
MIRSVKRFLANWNHLIQNNLDKSRLDVIDAATGSPTAKVPINDTSRARVTGYGVSCLVDPDRVVHHVCFDVRALAKRKILEGHVTEGARSCAFESLCAKRLAGRHDKWAPPSN